MLTDLTNLLSISTNHRKELHKKRGFTDETIDHFQFKSGSPNNQTIIKTWITKHPGAAELTRLGWGNPENIEQLIHPETIDGDRKFSNILIPYWNLRHDHISRLRPHKRGFANSGVDFFYAIQPGEENLWVCESEFKAVALWQLGFSAISIHGVAMLSDSDGGKKRRTDLLVLCKELGIKYIHICFDNERKDQLGELNYKANPKKRYDTPYFTYLTAYLLQRSLPFKEEKPKINPGEQVEQTAEAETKAKKNEEDPGYNPRILIKVIPHQWRDHGKIDIDGFLAKGGKKSDVHQFLNFTPSEYLTYCKSNGEYLLQPEAGQVIQSKLHVHFTFNNRFPVVEANFRYFKQTKEGKKSRQLSNFTFKIQRFYRDEDGVVSYDLTLTNDLGIIHRIERSEDGMFNSSDQFKKVVRRYGNFIWGGSDSMLNKVLEMEIVKMHDWNHVNLLKRVGFIDQFNLWVFKNCLIKDGKIYNETYNNVIYIPNDAGYTVDKAKFKGQFTKGDLPAPQFKKAPEDRIDSLVNALKDICGKEEEYWGLLGLGFHIACIFMDDLFKKFNQFPFLFITGEKDSGKTTFCQLLYRLWGFSRNIDPLSFESTTQVGLDETLAEYGNIPIWIDEYTNRNEKFMRRNGIKDSVLKGLYNRAVAIKGSLNGTISSCPHTSMIFSGEANFEDYALLSRIILIPYYYKNQQAYKDYNQLGDLSDVLFDIIRNKDVYSSFFFERLNQFREKYQGKYEDRIVYNYGVVFAGLSLIAVDFTCDILINGFANYAMNKLKEYVQSEDHTIQFWKDVVYLYSNDMLTRYDFQVIRKRIPEEPFHKEALCINYSNVYRSLRKFKATMYDENTIRDYLKNKSYYLAIGTVNLGGNSNKRLKMMQFDSKHSSTPEEVLHLVDLIKEECQDSRAIDEPYENKNIPFTV